MGVEEGEGEEEYYEEEYYSEAGPSEARYDVANRRVDNLFAHLMSARAVDPRYKGWAQVLEAGPPRHLTAVAFPSSTIAAAVLLDFDAYARPGSLCGLECRSLISVDGSRFCLVFFPGDREARSKAQTQDDTVEIGVMGRDWFRGNFCVYSLTIF